MIPPPAVHRASSSQHHPSSIRHSPIVTSTRLVQPTFPHPLQPTPTPTNQSEVTSPTFSRTRSTPPLITTGIRYPQQRSSASRTHTHTHTHTHTQQHIPVSTRIASLFRRGRPKQPSITSTPTSTSTSSQPETESADWILADDDTPEVVTSTTSTSAPTTPTHLDAAVSSGSVRPITTRHPSRIHQWRHGLRRAKGLIHTMITTTHTDSDMSLTSLSQAFSLSSFTSYATCSHQFTNAPTWLLGYCYKYLAEAPPHRTNGEDDRQRRVEAFIHDYTSRVWITYRKGFPEIGHSGYGTDAGWGCMLRSAQMILIQAYIMHYLGRSWRWSITPDETYTRILTWFTDQPHATSPYSIHHMLEYGEDSGGKGNTNGKKVGEWFGPFATCAMLDKCVKRHNLPAPAPVLIMSEDGTLYYDQIMHKCIIKEEKHTTETVPATSNATASNTIPPANTATTSTSSLDATPDAPTTSSTSQLPPSVHSRSSSISSSDTEQDEVIVRVPHVHTLSSSSSIDSISSDATTPATTTSTSQDQLSQQEQQPQQQQDPSALEKAHAVATATLSATSQLASATLSSFLSYASSAISRTPPLTDVTSPGSCTLSETSPSSSLSSSHVDVSHPTDSPPTIPSTSPPRHSYSSVSATQSSSIENDPHWRACIILIPVRLGMGDRMNPDYIPNLLSCFQFPQSLGLIGGKPRTAYYFIGVQDNKLFYLDPHTVQKAVNPADEKDWSSYHCSSIQSVPVTSIDPSLAIGFYCRTRADFDAFWEQAKALSSTKYPVFSVSDKSPSYLFDDMDDDDDEEDEEDDEDEDASIPSQGTAPIPIIHTIKPSHSPNSLSSSVSEGQLVDDDSLSLTGSPVMVSASSSPALPPPNFQLENAASDEAHRTPPPHQHMPIQGTPPHSHMHHDMSSPHTSSPHTRRQGSKRRSQRNPRTPAAAAAAAAAAEDDDEFVLL